MSPRKRPKLWLSFQRPLDARNTHIFARGPAYLSLRDAFPLRELEDMAFFVRDGNTLLDISLATFARTRKFGLRRGH